MGRKKMALWRVHIRPDAVDHKQAYQFCLDNNIIGVGWRVNDPINPDLVGEGFSEEKLGIEDFDRYLERAEKVYKTGLGSVRALFQMEINDLVWMRSPQGIYHLCRILEAWRYDGDKVHRNLDVVNMRTVEIMEIGIEDNVPGQIVNSFIPSKTVQRIQNDTAVAYSQYLWNKEHKNSFQHIPVNADIFSLLSPFECEDLVSIYLQTRGLIVYLPPSKRTGIAYEYVVRRKEKPYEISVVQVKMGGASINVGELPGRSFVFQPNGQYHGNNPECTIIQRNEMVGFIRDCKDILPRRIQNFIEWIGIENLQ